MLKVILFIFLMNSPTSIKLVDTLDVKTLEECVAQATYINSNKENPYNAACYTIQIEADT